jgi:hypothetical protein
MFMQTRFPRNSQCTYICDGGCWRAVFAAVVQPLARRPLVQALSLQPGRLCRSCCLCRSKQTEPGPADLREVRGNDPLASMPRCLAQRTGLGPRIRTEVVLIKARQRRNTAEVLHEPLLSETRLHHLGARPRRRPHHRPAADERSFSPASRASCAWNFGAKRRSPVSRECIPCWYLDGRENPNGAPANPYDPGFHLIRWTICVPSHLPSAKGNDMPCRGGERPGKLLGCLTERRAVL